MCWNLAHSESEVTMKIITMISGKGGVSKTTSATNLGASLAIMGYRVLMVDVDKQCHTSMQFNRFDQKALSIGHVFLDKVHPYKTIQNTDIANVDIIPANYEHLEEATKKLIANTIIGRLEGLLELEYEFIIID
jgi:chromosome partitioning protein